MIQNDETVPSRATGRARSRTLAVGVGLVAAGALAGGVLAGTLSASADTSPTPSSSTQGTAPNGQNAPDGQSGVPGQGPRHGGMRDHGSASVRPDEKALSTDDAAKVKAAALKAVPGGTVHRVETDAGDGEYEAHMTKADGTEATVKLDKSFAVAGVEDGMGRGDPDLGGQRGPQGQSGRQGQPPAGGQGSAPSTSGTPSA